MPPYDTAVTITASMEPPPSQTAQPLVGKEGVIDFVNFNTGANPNDHNRPYHGAFPVGTNGLTLTWLAHVSKNATWATGTVIVAIVFGTKEGSTTPCPAYAANHGGAFDYVASLSAETHFTSEHDWAPPSGSVAETSVLFLADDFSHWKVKVNRNKLSPTNWVSYKYRMYFYTPSIGLWYRDPEVDLCQMTDTEPPDPKT